MPLRMVLLHAAVLLGLAAYLVLFYATRLPSAEGVTGSTFRRVEFFWLLLLPEELASGWFGTPAEFALLDRLPVLAIAALILGCSVSLGWLLIALCRLDRGWMRLETLVFSAGVGLNAVSTYVLLVGLVRLLGNGFVFAVPAALTLLATGYLWWKRRRAPLEQGKNIPQRDRGTSQRRNGNREGEDWLGPRWLWLAVPFVLVIMLGGMLPPIEFDVREYHLQVPKEFFEQGSIGFLPHNVYGNMPLGTEMLSLLAMEIAGDWWLGALAGKTVIAAFAPLTALALFSAGRRFISMTAGVVAAVLYISVPWVAWVSTNGLVEGASAFYLLLATYAVLLWRQGEEERFLTPFAALAGYLAGGAVSCKYPAVLFVVVPLALFIALVRLPTRWRACWKPAGAFLLAAAVACGLWFGKNWVLAENPSYPLLYGVFGGKTWTAEKDAQWNRAHRPHDFSAPTLARDLGRVAWRSEWLSPLVMPLAVLALARHGKRRLPLLLLAYFAFVIAAWWLLTHRLDRFWIPALPLAALSAGSGACWSHRRPWRASLIGLLVVASLSNFLVASSAGRAKYNRYFVRLERLRTDPMRVDPWHRYFNRFAADGRVLMVGEAQVFDVEAPILYNTCFDDSIFEKLIRGRTSAEAHAALLDQGISHVYVHWGEIDRYRSPGNYGFTDFVEPAVFERLVRAEVLLPLPEMDGHPGRGYRVLAAGH